MRKTLIRKVLMISTVIASAVVTTGYSYADRGLGNGCSNATLKGSYIGGNTGDVAAVPGGHISSIHMFYFDGKGNVSSRTTTTTGALTPPISQSNYDIDPQCHGTTNNDAGTATLVFEASPKGDSFVGINQDVNLLAVSGPVSAERVSHDDLVNP